MNTTSPTPSNHPWGRYETLRPAQIEAIRDVAPIAYVPWGALEWHSYHNPVGLDGLKAHGLCSALAERTGGVVLPAVYVGTETIKPYKGFPHTIDHSFNSVKYLAIEFLEQLADEKFKVVVLITGHYPGEQRRAVVEAGDEVQARHPEARFWAFPDCDPTSDLFASDHAALSETSFQLLFGAEYVDLSLLPTDRQTTLDEDGVMGEDPRNATAEEGARRLGLFLERAVPRIEGLLRDVQS